MYNFYKWYDYTTHHKVNNWWLVRMGIWLTIFTFTFFFKYITWFPFLILLHSLFIIDWLEWEIYYFILPGNDSFSSKIQQKLPKIKTINYISLLWYYKMIVWFFILKKTMMMIISSIISSKINDSSTFSLCIITIVLWIACLTGLFWQ